MFLRSSFTRDIIGFRSGTAWRGGISNPNTERATDSQRLRTRFYENSFPRQKRVAAIVIAETYRVTYYPRRPT